MRLPIWTWPLLFSFARISAAADDPQEKAQQLAREVWKASGGENWAKVSALRFTFIVEDQGKKLMAAEHRWDLNANTDHVKWKEKEVTVNLASPPQDEDGKAAYARWVNDSYWLLAPLKILDPGVKLTYEGQKDIAGASCEALRITFDQVGLTPTDQYVLYIDPNTKLVRAWDYIPKPETVMHGSWARYETVGGLRLATEHEFGGKVIRLADIEVSTR